MPRDWAGSVFLTPGRNTYTAKYPGFAVDGATRRWIAKKGFKTKPEARAFLAKERRDQLARERGEFDVYGEHRRTPIAKHLEAFVDHVKSGIRRRPRKRPNKHVDLLSARLERAFAEMNVAGLGDLTLDKATRFLIRLVDHEKASTKTRNDYRAALVQFCRWAVASDRLAKSPLAALKKVDDQPAQRQAIDAATVQRLAAAAIQRVLQRSMPGNRDRDLEAARKRAMTVLIAFLAGLRNNEIANLTWSMIDHQAGVVTIPATVAKSAREQSVPLHSGLSDLLQAVRKERSVAQKRAVADSDFVVGYLDERGNPTLPVHLAERIREDADWIGHPTIDADGRSLDLHAMRTSFANELASRGVHDGIIGDLMRHQAPSVTRRHYVRRDAAALRQFVDLIPRETVNVPGLLTGNHGGNQDGSALATEVV